ncbi:hypothetical protein [Desulfitobacterium sp. AusDCA]|uniref:hypothetical protein n=1 Tax=Desulfitobacterium sp. AusDCA TaxID=3240383 RepID=UPI003DA774BF
MSNQWERRPRIPELLIVVVLIIIGYLLFSYFFKNISSQVNPTASASSINDINSSSINDPNALNSSGSSSPLLPNANNTLNSGSGNNALASGYWILFVSNGTSQQLSVSAQDYAFIQGLIQSDSKGSPTVTLFLIENGQIHQHIVSNEIYSILSNMATIITQGSNPSSSANSTSSSSTTMLPSAATSETMTVSNPSASGFTLTLNPKLNGLTLSNFTLVNSLGSPVTLTGATTSDSGSTYAISAALTAGQTYTLTAASTGYTFGTAVNVVVP